MGLHWQSRKMQQSHLDQVAIIQSIHLNMMVTQNLVSQRDKVLSTKDSLNSFLLHLLITKMPPLLRMQQQDLVLVPPSNVHKLQKLLYLFPDLALMHYLLKQEMSRLESQWQVSYNHLLWILLFWRTLGQELTMETLEKPNSLILIGALVLLQEMMKKKLWEGLATSLLQILTHQIIKLDSLKDPTGVSAPVRGQDWLWENLTHQVCKLIIFLPEQ